MLGTSRFTASIRKMASVKTWRDADNFGGSLLHQRLNFSVKAALSLLILIGPSTSAFAAETGAEQGWCTTIEPAVWQGPASSPQLITPASSSSTASNTTIRVASSQPGAASNNPSLPTITPAQANGAAPRGIPIPPCSTANFPPRSCCRLSLKAEPARMASMNRFSPMAAAIRPIGPGAAAARRIAPGPACATTGKSAAAGTSRSTDLS